MFAEELLQMVERRPQRQFLTGIIADMNEMLAHYIRMQLILSGLSILAYMGMLSLLRLLEFIPVVGPLVGAAIILGVGFLANYHHLLIVTLFLGGWRILQDYVTTPHLMGSKLQLHPLTVIFAVLVGAEIGGVIGASAFPDLPNGGEGAKKDVSKNRGHYPTCLPGPRVCGN